MPSILVTVVFIKNIIKFVLSKHVPAKIRHVLNLLPVNIQLAVILIAIIVQCFLGKGKLAAEEQPAELRP